MSWFISNTISAAKSDTPHTPRELSCGGPIPTVFLIHDQIAPTSIFHTLLTR